MTIPDDARTWFLAGFIMAALAAEISRQRLEIQFLQEKYQHERKIREEESRPKTLN